jgi:4-amino-4-deoxy-L-arabinose transferase-like glycosyltransferase
MIDKLICFFKTLNEKQVLLLLIGISFGLRLYAVLMSQGIANDSAAYGFMARDFLKGLFIKGLSSTAAPPFYPFLIFLFSPDTAHVEIAGRLISLFFGTFAVIPLFYLVKEAVGRKEAIFSVFFYSFHPYLVTYSGMLLTEATYLGLLVLSVYFFWTGLGKQVTWKIGFAGCLLGLAYLTRPEGVGYVLVYLVWIAVWGGVRKKWLKKSILITTLLLTVSIFVVPYVNYIHRETGQWLISKKALDAQSRFLKEGTGGVDSSKAIEKYGLVEKNSNIFRITRNVVRFVPFVTYHYLRAYHFSLWLFLFFGLIKVRRKVIPYELFLASLVLFHLLSLSTFVPSTIRFAVPVIPLSLFWAGAGIIEMKRYLEKIKVFNPEKAIFLFTVLAILIQLPQSLTPERRHRAEQKKVGLWLKQNTPLDAVIMSNSPQETFYADREFMLFPSGSSRPGYRGQSYDEVIHYARTKGVRYILVNRNTYEAIPGFIDSIRPTDLREIFSRADQGTIIYEVIR